MQTFCRRPLVTLISLFLLVAGTASPPASAQAFREKPGGELPPYVRTAGIAPAFTAATPEMIAATGNGLPNVMLVGYWPPTNEMIRHFSPDPVQNPQGWAGANWEGRGYNVYAFFPEFPSGIGKGVGDFEVDYQDTSGDFARITSLVKPRALVTFGRAYPDNSWELEWRTRNLDAPAWVDDYLSPFDPTPCPPDGSVPVGFTRYSSLPLDAIVAAVNAAPIGVNAFADLNGDAGNFLCEFLGYHASAYTALHAAPGDPHQAVGGGHVHVGSAISLLHATAAAEATVRALIDALEAPLLPNRRDISGISGGVVSFRLDAGTTQGFRDYVLFGGASGSAPGTLLPGGLVTLPLNGDGLTTYLIGLQPHPALAGFAGILDASGLGRARLSAPPQPAHVGRTLTFAFALRSPAWDYASNAVDIAIVP